MSIYDFTVKNIENEDVSLSAFQGKVLLIVNTATGCGFTPQYEGLETLYEKYGEQGFEILDFPCNQFLNQAPGTNEEIVNFCKINYGVSFQTFAKIKVNGKDADPLYVYLKAQTPQDTENEKAGAFKKILQDLSQVVLGDEIKWNFTKFLIDKQGNVVSRFGPTVTPEEIAPHIEKLLIK